MTRGDRIRMWAFIIGMFLLVSAYPIIWILTRS